MMFVQKVRVDIRRTRRRRDPLIPELRVALEAHLKCERKRLTFVAAVSARRCMLHGKGRESQPFPICRYGRRFPHNGAEGVIEAGCVRAGITRCWR